jgi:hypothetical protein
MEPAAVIVQMGDASEIPPGVDVVHTMEHLVSEQFDGARVAIQDGYVFVFDASDHAVRYRLVVE